MSASTLEVMIVTQYSTVKVNTIERLNDVSLGALPFALQPPWQSMQVLWLATWEAEAKGKYALTYVDLKSKFLLPTWLAPECYGARKDSEWMLNANLTGNSSLQLGQEISKLTEPVKFFKWLHQWLAAMHR